MLQQIRHNCSNAVTHVNELYSANQRSFVFIIAISFS